MGIPNWKRPKNRAALRAMRPGMAAVQIDADGHGEGVHGQGQAYEEISEHAEL
jgi:hypothetical protein